jgi:glycerol-3-phosphate dehydrogenase (NAD(P)+)
MTDIAIVGAGNMGTAMTMPLAANGHRVRLVGTHLDDDVIRHCLATGAHPRLKRRLPAGVRPYYYADIAEALEGVDVILSGVNSLGVHWLGQTLGRLIRPGTTILAVTKGMEAGPDGELRTLVDVLEAELPAGLREQVQVAAVAGPVLAAELAACRPSAAVFTGHDEATLRRLRDLFHCDFYRVWLSTDVTGVETCSALKNGYAIAVGAAGGMLERAGGPDELGVAMHNLAATLFGAAGWEMRRLLEIMGGRPETLAWLPWAGDQYVTVTGGRTYRLGRALGRGLTYREAQVELAEPTLEGAFVVQQVARALPAWERRGVLGRDELPLMRMLVRTMTEDRPIEIPWDDLFGHGAVIL